MSKNVFILPIDKSILNEYLQLIKCENFNNFNYTSREIEIQQNVLYYSNYFISKLKSTQNYSETNYLLYTKYRPYFIVEPDYNKVPAIVDELRTEDDNGIINIFITELNKIEKNTFDLKIEKYLGAQVLDYFFELIQKIITLKKSIQKDKPYSTLIPRYKENDYKSFYSLNEFVEKKLSGEELISYFIHLTSQTFGLITSKALPSWYPGNNIWLGRLFYSDIFENKNLKKYHIIFKTLKETSVSSSILFNKTGVDGFNKEIDITCKKYSLGLYIPKDKVSKLYSVFIEEYELLLELFSVITGKKESHIKISVDVILEAIKYCLKKSTGLIEGDCVR